MRRFRRSRVVRVPRRRYLFRLRSRWAPCGAATLFLWGRRPAWVSDVSRRRATFRLPTLWRGAAPQFFCLAFQRLRSMPRGTPLSGDIFHRTRTACAVESLKAGANNYRPLMRAIASLWIQMGKPCELSLKSASFVAVVDGGVELRGVFFQRDINWGRRVPCAEAVFASSCPSLQSIGEGRGWP